MEISAIGSDNCRLPELIYVGVITGTSTLEFRYGINSASRNIVYIRDLAGHEEVRLCVAMYSGAITPGYWTFNSSPVPIFPYSHNWGYSLEDMTIKVNEQDSTSAARGNFEEKSYSEQYLLPNFRWTFTRTISRLDAHMKHPCHWCFLQLLTRSPSYLGYIKEELTLRSMHTYARRF